MPGSLEKDFQGQGWRFLLELFKMGCAGCLVCHEYVGAGVFVFPKDVFLLLLSSSRRQ
jgi:hypothetical protein